MLLTIASFKKKFNTIISFYFCVDVIESSSYLNTSYQNSYIQKNKSCIFNAFNVKIIKLTKHLGQ